MKKATKSRSADKRDDCDHNEKGQRVQWEIELWEYKNFLRSDIHITYKTFNHKTQAQQYIAQHIAQRLVCELKVTRLTYDRPADTAQLYGKYSILPSRTIMLNQHVYIE